MFPYFTEKFSELVDKEGATRGGFNTGTQDGVRRVGVREVVESGDAQTFCRRKLQSRKGRDILLFAQPPYFQSPYWCWTESGRRHLLEDKGEGRIVKQKTGLKCEVRATGKLGRSGQTRDDMSEEN